MTISQGIESCNEAQEAEVDQLEDAAGRSLQSLTRLPMCAEWGKRDRRDRPYPRGILRATSMIQKSHCLRKQMFVSRRSPLYKQPDGVSRRSQAEPARARGVRYCLWGYWHKPPLRAARSFSPAIGLTPTPPTILGIL